MTGLVEMSYIVCSQPGHHGNVSPRRPEGCPLLAEATVALLRPGTGRERKHPRIPGAISRSKSQGLFAAVPVEERVLEVENVLGFP